MAKNTPLHKDWVLIGALSGSIVAFAGEVFRASMQKAGVPTVRYASIAGDFMLGKKSKGPATNAEAAIGWLSHMAIGSLFGTGLSYIYAMTPPGNEAVKGVVGGIAYWTSTIGLSNQLGLVRLHPFELANCLASSMIFGAMHGAIIGKYGSKLITQSHPIMVQGTDMQNFDRGRLTWQPQISNQGGRLH